jgi:hypothetical protein
LQFLATGFQRASLRPHALELSSVSVRV